ncbi:NAAT family transporter [Oscillatoria sp. FACHB-1407]|uniref:MarC family protein n=1 Tax=Oscillatoria sp. FACHB-1407 TaxID=2692847 RepID=UPI00168754CE|nr:MarC family protein [Oscillatoria sp. FACHB-1407]MBD2459561.1 NAAT family transporter [Oscillatoria sp. FACHB-1407]
MSFLARAFLTLLVVIDPVGLVPIFITLAGKYTSAQQERIARQAVLIAGSILLIFALIGNWLLRYLGISIEAFQVAGGLLLLKIAVDMVFAHRERETAEEEQEAQLREDISTFPLAIPLIAGPGTLASLLILTSEADGHGSSLVAIMAIVVVVLAIAYLLFRLSKRLAFAFGKTGINVITRVLGVLLAALAVQYVVNGTTVVLKTALGPR